VEERRGIKKQVKNRFFIKSSSSRDYEDEDEGKDKRAFLQEEIPSHSNLTHQPN
jgi:hypothetical protein